MALRRACRLARSPVTAAAEAGLADAEDDGGGRPAHRGLAHDFKHILALIIGLAGDGTAPSCRPRASGGRQRSSSNATRRQARASLTTAPSPFSAASSARTASARSQQPVGAISEMLRRHVSAKRSFGPSLSGGLLARCFADPAQVESSWLANLASRLDAMAGAAQSHTIERATRSRRALRLAPPGRSDLLPVT